MTKPKPKLPVKQRTTADAQREREESGEIAFQLRRAKLSDIKIVDNISRANIQHEYHEIQALAERIVHNNFWDPPHCVKNRKGELELADGHMRIAAATLLQSEGRLPEICGNNKEGVHILIIKRTQAERDALNMASTVIKKGQSTYQKAHALWELQKRHGHPNKKLAEQYGLDHKSVANYIRAARDLCPRIQRAWLNFERGESPIGMTQLLYWASLPPDDQEAEFQASRWGEIYTLSERASKHPHKAGIVTQPREVIQYAYEHVTDPKIKHTLEWVLRKRIDLDGEQYGSGRDSSRSGRGQSSTPSNPTPSHRGSKRPSNKDSSLLWEDESGESNSTPDSPQGASNGKSRAYVDGSEDINADNVDEFTAYAKRTFRNPGGN